MLCAKCDQPARGVCRFCGRALCPDHFGDMPFVLTIFVGAENTPKAIVVGGALYCGLCKPQRRPLAMPEIY